MFNHAKKDEQTATSDGTIVRELLEGVALKETQNIVTRNGITTELYRPEWKLDAYGIEHMIHVNLRPRVVSAWHMHEKQTDRIFTVSGYLRIVLYDGRESSPTFQRLNVFNLSRYRPSIVSIPPGVWHGIQNLDNSEGSFVNYFNRAYCYENPDEWRLPADTKEIPYTFIRE